MSTASRMRGILTYHSIDAGGSVISVDPRAFEGQMAWLAEANVPVLPLEQLVGPDAPAGIALTFDDAFQNFADVAWPILQRFGFPATVYVPSEWVGRSNAWDEDDDRIPDLPLMSWGTLKRLAAEGLSLGGHSATHPRLSTLSAEALRAEIQASTDHIESRTGQRPTSFAYPYGDYDPATVQAVRAAGYTMAVTTEMRLLGDRHFEPLELPRLDAFYFRDGNLLKAWGTDRLRRFVRFRAGARRVRSALRKARLVS